MELCCGREVCFLSSFEIWSLLAFFLLMMGFCVKVEIVDL